MSAKQCKKCGRLIGKTLGHQCPTSVWNKGKKGLQTAWNKGIKSKASTRKKLSDTRKKLFKEGKLPDISGKNNPMYGKIPYNKGKTGLHKSPMKGKKVPLEIRLKTSGPNHYNWKGGENSINKRIRKSYEYRRWTREILERDDFTCLCCKARGGKLDVHHLKPFSLIVKEYNIKTLDAAISCLDLWDKDNAQTLCKPCHRKTDSFLKNTQKCYNIVINH